jgi:hypothetical protein
MKWASCFAMALGSGAVALPAMAGVVYEPNPANIGSQYREGFQNMPDGFVASYVLPSGMGTLVSNNGAPNLLNTVGWSFFSTILPYEGTRFQGDAGCNGYTITFSSATTAFGAYFGTNSDKAGGTIELFDQVGASLGVLPIQGPLGGSWSWDGWKGTNGTLISKAKITPGNQWGGFLMIDAAATGVVPAPAGAAVLALAALMGVRRRR